MRLRPFPVSGLAALTLFIWGNRIWLAWTNDEDSLGEKLLWSLPITVFVIAALILVAGAATGRSLTVGPLRSVASVLAYGTIAFWAVRAPMITLADHPVGFKVVHAVLAIASIGASVMAVRALRASGAVHGGPAVHDAGVGRSAEGRRAPA